MKLGLWIAEARRSRIGPPAALVVTFVVLDELRGQPPWTKGLAALVIMLVYFMAYWAADSVAGWLVARRRPS